MKVAHAWLHGGLILAFLACGGRSSLGDGEGTQSAPSPACAADEAETMLIATGSVGEPIQLQRLEPLSGSLTALGVIDCPFSFSDAVVQSLAWSRRGHLYLGPFNPAELFHVDLPTLECEAVAFPDSGAPALMTFVEDPDGATDDELLVGFFLAQGIGPAGQRLGLYDPDTLARSELREFAQEPNLLGMGAAGQRLLAVYPADNAFAVAPIDIAEPRIVTEAGQAFIPESNPFVFTATVFAGQLVYFASYDGTTEVGRVDPTTGTVDQLPPLGVEVQAAAALSCP